MIQTPDALRDLITRARQAPRVALDTEFVWERTYYPNLGLVQLGLDRDHTFLIDTVALQGDDLRPLGELMADADVVKILHDAQQDVVSLSREVESLSDYIDLQMIRWENSVNVDYRVSGETDGKYIAPVILQPFIENAFKHGVSTEAETQINIMIIIEGEQLKLSVENEKVKLTNQHEERSGMGIENTRLRLNLIYPSVHTLTITENEHTFQVALTLKLKTGNA